MNRISNIIDELVKEIKRDDDFSNICFVKGFSVTENPDPFSDYMIAVSTLDSHMQSEFLGDIVGENLTGNMFEVTVKFRIYAPKNDGGDGLVDMSNRMCESIKRHDVHSVCKDIKVSSIAFDEGAMTVYRDVVALMSFCVIEEVSG